MKYMLLICEDSSLPQRDEAAIASLMADYGAFTQGIVESGELVAGDQLDRADTATSVRLRNGTATITDGPFVETTEVIGGYYVVDVKDLDRALELAAQIPSARSGVVEVRPIIDMQG